MRVDTLSVKGRINASAENIDQDRSAQSTQAYLGRNFFY